MTGAEGVGEGLPLVPGNGCPVAGWPGCGWPS
jgi:hypothetical protein